MAENGGRRFFSNRGFVIVRGFLKIQEQFNG